MANNKAWENLSKFLYDIAKIIFAGFVVGSVMSDEPPNRLLLSV